MAYQTGEVQSTPYKHALKCQNSDSLCTRRLVRSGLHDLAFLMLEVSFPTTRPTHFRYDDTSIAAPELFHDATRLLFSEEHLLQDNVIISTAVQSTDFHLVQDSSKTIGLGKCKKENRTSLR